VSAIPLRRNRDFVLLQVGQALSTLGTESTRIAYPLLVLALTHSPAKAGIVGFAQFLPYVLFAVPAGLAADRWSRRRLMLLADGGRVAAIGSLVATLAMHVASFPQIVVVAFVEGALFALFNIAETGALRAVVPAPQLPRAAAGEQSRIATVQLAAPSVGGALFGVARLVPFLFDAVSYAFSVVSLLAIRTPFQEERNRSAVRAREQVAEAYQWLREHRFLWAAQLLAAMSNVVYEAAFLTLVVSARRQGLSSAAIGGLVAALGATMLAGSLFAPVLQRRLSVRAITRLQSWPLFALVAFVAVPNPFVLAAAALPALFLVPTTAATVIGLRNGLAPDRLVGRINGIARTLAVSGTPLGSLAAGFLLGAFSERATVTILLVWTAVLTLWAFASPSLRESPSLAELDPVAA
jgi:fucose permease